MIVHKKRLWILEKQQRAKEQHRARIRKQFIDGEEFPYLGISYKLRVLPEAHKAFEFNGTEFLIVQEALPRAKRIFQAWYIQKAREHIPARVQIYAQRAEQDHANITITSAQRRWGSCTSRKTLNFSWRLMMAPLEMIDYVVAHEVAHLSHLDHSPRFWNKVKSLMPDHRIKEQWFKDNQHLLNF